MAKTGMKLEGHRALNNLLAKLPDKIADKALKQAVNAAATPTLKATKELVPVESSTLLLSLKKKAKLYKTDHVAVALIGADKNVSSEYKGNKRNPSKYIHLVDQGTSHSKASDFLHDGFEQSKEKSKAIMTKKLTEVCIKEANKLKGK